MSTEQVKVARVSDVPKRYNELNPHEKGYINKHYSAVIDIIRRSESGTVNSSGLYEKFDGEGSLGRHSLGRTLSALAAMNYVVRDETWDKWDIGRLDDSQWEDLEEALGEVVD